MLRYLLLRPIAVSMTLLVSLALSVVLYLSLPVSLLPALDVPEITMAVRYPTGSPEEIEQNLLKPIREAMPSTYLGIISFLIGGDNEIFWFAMAVGTIGGLLFSAITISVFFTMLTVTNEKIKSNVMKK